MALVLNQKDKKVKMIFRIVDEGLSLKLADETDQVIYQVSSEHEKAIFDYLLERRLQMIDSNPRSHLVRRMVELSMEEVSTIING